MYSKPKKMNSAELRNHRQAIKQRKEMKKLIAVLRDELPGRAFMSDYSLAKCVAESKDGDVCSIALAEYAARVLAIPMYIG